MTRKDDIVALQTKKTRFFCNSYGHENYEEWTLVRVASATRDGIVKTYRLIGHDGYPAYRVGAYGFQMIHCLPNHQEQAARLMTTRNSDDWFGSCDMLKAAILAA